MFVQAPVAVFDDHASGQVDPRPRQGFSKVAATVRQRGEYITPQCPQFGRHGGVSHPHDTEAMMQKVINCPCGFVVRGASDEEVVARAQEHARQVHQMELSRDQALAMAKPA